MKTDRFVLLDCADQAVTTVETATLVRTLTGLMRSEPAVMSACGHAGFRVPDLRRLLPILRDIADDIGQPVQLQSTLADARHSSDDRGCSPLRVHVDVPGAGSEIVTRKERLRLQRADDPYVSQIPFGAPKAHDADGLSHRTILQAYRRVVSGDLYRWISARVMAATDRTLRDATPSLLTFHTHLRDVVLEEQFIGADAVHLSSTRSTAFPDGFEEHIVATHGNQAAVAVDLFRSEEHAAEVLRFFTSMRRSMPDAGFPRWLFAPAEPACYFCRCATAVSRCSPIADAVNVG